MIELHSAPDMRMTYYTNYCNAFGIAVSPDPFSLSTWKGCDQTNHLQETYYSGEESPRLQIRGVNKEVVKVKLVNGVRQRFLRNREIQSRMRKHLTTLRPH